MAARECIAENRILRRIAPGSFEENNGLFVALDESDLDYRDSFLESCRACAIEAQEISPALARQWEPALNPCLLAAVRVPDAVMDAWRLPLRFFATAVSNGAEIYPYTEAVELERSAGKVTGARLLDLRRRREMRIEADLVVLATGAWSAGIGATAAVDIPVQPAPGVMVAAAPRLVNMVINRLRPAGEGDIVVPQRNLTIAGTSLWLAEDPERFEIPDGQAERMIELGAEMVPGLAKAQLKAVWSAARPLLAEETAAGPQGITRRFECIDHLDRDGLDGLVSLIGGKATTMRAMAQVAADLICRKLGRRAPCRTETTALLPHRAFYRGRIGKR